jgi:hypothetical protein
MKIIIAALALVASTAAHADGLYLPPPPLEPLVRPHAPPRPVYVSPPAVIVVQPIVVAPPYYAPPPPPVAYYGPPIDPGPAIVGGLIGAAVASALAPRHRYYGYRARRW